MPTNASPSSTGTALMPCVRRMSATSPTVLSGLTDTTCLVITSFAFIVLFLFPSPILVPRPEPAGAYPGRPSGRGQARIGARSEEHTSELQSLMRISYAVFFLKKKNQYHLYCPFF